MKPSQTKNKAFTLIELLVVVAIIGILGALLLPALAKARTKSRAVACITNEKQWGLAFQMYADDNNGVLFYQDSGTGNWDDTVVYAPNNQPNPYVRYFAAFSSTGGGRPAEKLRRMRHCPAASLSDHVVIDLGVHQYALAQPSMLTSLGWAAVVKKSFGWFVTIRLASKPSEYLLLIDTGTDDGSVAHEYVAPGQLVSFTSDAMRRHGGAVNALFADYHVEAVPPHKIQEMDKITSGSPSKWFRLD